jgi:hypothetical protein
MVKGFYDVTSTFKLSLPTPIMAGVRTPTRQFSSCVLIESGDSLKAINGTVPRSSITFLNVPALALALAVFVRWAVKSATAKRLIPVLSLS